MAVNVYEDIRLFKEYYGGSKMRRQVLYMFCHRFLPQYVTKNPWGFFKPLFAYDMHLGNADPVCFIQSRWQMMEDTYGWSKPQKELGRITLRRVKDLYMWVQEIKGHPSVFIELPLPEMPGQAYYMAVVLMAQGSNPEGWAKDTHARVFALEQSALGERARPRQGLFLEWPYCAEQREQQGMADVSLDAFRDCVQDVLTKCCTVSKR